jgi:hypothetical protein
VLVDLGFPPIFKTCFWLAKPKACAFGCLEWGGWQLRDEGLLPPVVLKCGNPAISFLGGLTPSSRFAWATNSLLVRI